MLYIENARLILENEILSDGALLIEDGRILKVGARGSFAAPQEAQRMDAEGLYIGPGFVDIHVHGGGGAEFFEEPLKAAEYFLRHGTTTILPSSKMRFDVDFCLESYDRIRAAQKAGGAGRAIAGVYMEGPFMNPKYGANPELNIWRGAIRPERYRPLVEGGGALIKVWAVAPEREGLAPFMEYAKKVNPAVRFAIGHSEATPEQIEALKGFGFQIQTHCMDATGRISEWEGTRGSGPDEYCFLDEEMFAELICDSGGVHVSSTLQRLILKVKGLDRVVLITDSNVSDCEPPQALKKYDDLSFDSKGRLAGSRLTMDRAFRNIMKHTGLGPREAFLLASRNPAKAIGMGEEIGTIEAGKRANLVFLDDGFVVRKVLLEGREPD